MVNVSFPLVACITSESPAEEWHWKHCAWPKYNCLPRSSDAESVYTFLDGVPYLEASYFELKPFTSPVDSYAATAREKSTSIWWGEYFAKASSPYTFLNREV